MKIVPPLVMIGLGIVACSLFSVPSPGSETSTPVSSGVITANSATVTPSVPALTVDQLKNAAYQLVAQDSHKTVQLVNGKYQNGSDPASPDYASVTLAQPMAFGDLNGDGVSDAAVLLAENYGGTGVFVSVIAILNQNGKPVQAGSELIDDRPIINSLTIKDEQILLDVTIHGPNDPGCCAAQPNKRVYRYEAGRLVLTGLSMTTPDHHERIITIDTPAEGSIVSWPLTVTGSFTIAPFENNLVYSVYDMNHAQISQGPLLVNAPQPGGPGTFSLPLDLTKYSVKGPLRIQVEDLSAADGAILALASVKVNVK